MRLGFWVETSGREKPLLQLSEEALVGPLGKVGGRRAGAHPRFQRSLEKIDQISSERVYLRVQIEFVCLVAPAFGGGVLALDFRRGATRRKIPEPPCRGKRDLRAGLRAAGFKPLFVAVSCEAPVRNFANLQERRSVSGAIGFIGVWIAPGKETPMSGIPPLTLRGLGSSRAPAS